MKMEREMKCPKCNYEWKTKSKLLMVTCPSCQLKVKTIKEDKTDATDTH